MLFHITLYHIILWYIGMMDQPIFWEETIHQGRPIRYGKSQAWHPWHPWHPSHPEPCCGTWAPSPGTMVKNGWFKSDTYGIRMGRQLDMIRRGIYALM